MKEAFEKIRKRLGEKTEFLSDCTKYGNKDAEQQRKSYDTMMMYEVADMVEDLIEVVSEVEAEYGNGWIPVEKELPKEYCNCLVTRKKEYSDGSFDYFVRDDVWIELEGCWGWQSEFEGWIENIIAWMPLPEPYKPEGGAKDESTDM